MNQVLIVGAGITGLGAAYHLAAHGIPYTILEASDDLGGVWSTHRWHGARCDSEFIKYSFSFRPLLSPSRLQTRAQIHRYLRTVADDFGILPNIRFNTRVTDAAFDSGAGRWVVRTSAGAFSSQFLINGNGYFADAYVPALEGASTFKGEIVHTALLDDRRTFHDEHVVLVGSGATAISCAPELSRVSRSLVLVQRSPSYIYELDNRAGLFVRTCQYLHTKGLSLPVRAIRYAIQCKDDAIFVAFRRCPALARWFFARHWRTTLDRDTLRRNLRPRYNPWDQRIPVALGLKEQLRNGKIVIKTGEIERFTESSLVMADGEAIPCDVCVLATGFDLSLLKFDMSVDERKVELGGVNFYKGVMLGGVPNYFHPFGAWHTAWTQRSETATRFAIRIMEYMRANGFRRVSIDRRDVGFTPPLTSGYITRSLAAMPRFYGTYDLPAIDNLVSYRFDPRAFRFA
jgi:cation diffusion facilitator CzcD-associated flavoprotein CzcO